MCELDHMLNGRGSRQHHQDILRCTQQERLAREVETAQRGHKTGTHTPGIARRSLAALRRFTTIIIGRRTRWDAADEMLQANRPSFAQALDNKAIEVGS